MELAENGTVVYHWGLLRFFYFPGVRFSPVTSPWPTSRRLAEVFRMPNRASTDGRMVLMAPGRQWKDLWYVKGAMAFSCFRCFFAFFHFKQLMSSSSWGFFWNCEGNRTWSPDKGYVQIILQKSISTICTSGRAIGNNQELRTTRKKKKKQTDSIWSMSRLWSNIGSGRLKQKNLINLPLMLEILKLQKRFAQNDYHISIPSPNHEIGNVYRSSQS